MRKRIKQPSVLSMVERIYESALSVASLLSTAMHVQWITPLATGADNFPTAGRYLAGGTVCSRMPTTSRPLAGIEYPTKAQSREELRCMWARSIQCLAYPPVLSFFHPRAKLWSTSIHDIEQIAIMEVTR